MSNVTVMHERLDAVKQLRNLADDIEQDGLNEDVKIVSIVEWPDGVEIYAGGKIPNLATANLIIDLGKKRIMDLS